jgi:hypothetical protein
MVTIPQNPGLLLKDIDDLDKRLLRKNIAGEQKQVEIY